MKKVCIIPGTFDPITSGHADIISRAAYIFDEVTVAAFNNTAKQTTFTAEERLEMLRLSYPTYSCNNIKTTMITDKLLVDYMNENDIKVIVKGVRNTIDFDYEYQLSVISREINHYGFETLFIPAKPEHMYISSTFVREMIKYKKDIDDYVPAQIVEYIKKLKY